MLLFLNYTVTGKYTSSKESPEQKSCALYASVIYRRVLQSRVTMKHSSSPCRLPWKRSTQSSVIPVLVMPAVVYAFVVLVS